MTKRPTLADVAARAGMSKTAVSLVLNDRPGSRLSAEAVARIHEAARELNYRPNAQARSLRLGTTGTVGFISDDVTVTRFASAMIRGLLDAADERDRGVLIAETFNHPKQMRKAMEAMVDRQVDGLDLRRPRRRGSSTCPRCPTACAPSPSTASTPTSPSPCCRPRMRRGMR